MTLPLLGGKHKLIAFLQQEEGVTLVEKSDPTAITALLVSLGAAIFSVFQWWSGEREAHIKAAIEISTAYLEDEDVPKQMIQLRKSKREGALLYPDGVEALIRRLNYIASLANRGRIAGEYLSDVVGCNIQEAFQIYTGQKSYNPYSSIEPKVGAMGPFIGTRNPCLGEEYGGIPKLRETPSPKDMKREFEESPPTGPQSSPHSN